MKNKILLLWDFILSFKGKFLDGVVLYYIINIGSYIILPKLYSFEIFGDFIYFSGFTLIFAFISTSKLEIFISNEKDTLIRSKLYNTQLTVIFLILLLVTSFIFLINQFFNFIDSIILISLFFITLSHVYIIVFNQKWLTTAEYKMIIYMRFFPYAILLLFQILAYVFFGDSLYSIIISSAISSLIVILILSLFILKNGIDFKIFYNFIITTKDKFIITIPSTSINVITQNITTIIIRNFIDSTTLGVYAVVTKVVGAPCSILGQFVIEKYKNSINQIFNNKKSLLPVFKYLTINLLYISLIVYSFFVLLYLFDIQKYLLNESVNFSIIIVILLFFTRMIISPLTYFTYFQKKIGFDLKLQSLHLLLISISILYIGKINNIIDALNIINIIIYLLYFYILFYKIKYDKKK